MKPAYLLVDARHESVVVPERGREELPRLIEAAPHVVDRGFVDEGIGEVRPGRNRQVPIRVEVPGGRVERLVRAPEIELEVERPLLRPEALQVPDRPFDEEEFVGRLHGRGDFAPVRVTRMGVLPGLLRDDEFEPVGSQVLLEQRVLVTAAAVSGEIIADEAAGRGERVARGEVPVRKRGRVGPRLGRVEAEMPLAGVPAAVAGRGRRRLRRSGVSGRSWTRHP